MILTENQLVIKKFTIITSILVLNTICSTGQNVQQRLLNGETPKIIFDSGIILDSIYGKEYGGGLIAYLNTSTGAGIISAPIDQSTSMSWKNGSPIQFPKQTAIGTGQSNTTAIVSAAGSGDYAAKICDDLVLNGYDDWFLPSIDELVQIYINLKTLNPPVGNFTSTLYWSSSENGDMHAWQCDFSGNGQVAGNEQYIAIYYVRAARYIASEVTIPPLEVLISKTDSCPHNSIAWASAKGGKEPYSFLWMPGGATSPKINGLSSGTYTLMVKDGADSMLIKTITISNNSGLPVNAGPDITIMAGDTTILMAEGYGTNFIWKPATALKCSNCQITPANPVKNITYTVSITNTNGCFTSDEVMISVREIIIPEIYCGEIFVPDIFSPNGDGENDTLYVRINPICLEQSDFIIYNRWGQKVFESTDITKGWDGTSDLEGIASGLEVNSGIYYYFVDAILSKNAEPIIQKGNISLVR